MAGKNNGFICCAKVLLIFICAMYLLNTILFDVVGPVIWYKATERSAAADSSTKYSHILFSIGWAMAFSDFVSCMAIMYMIHQFGPYRQYLRQADLLSSRHASSIRSAISFKSK